MKVVKITPKSTESIGNQSIEISEIGVLVILELAYMKKQAIAISREPTHWFQLSKYVVAGIKGIPSYTGNFCLDDSPKHS